MFSKFIILEVLKKELFEIGIKVNEKPPDVVVEKTTTGGISINIQAPIQVNENFIKNVMRINGYHNGRITIREKGLNYRSTHRRFIWKSYLHSFFSRGKQNRSSRSLIFKKRNFKVKYSFCMLFQQIPIQILKHLKKEIYDKLDFITNIYETKG